MALQYLIYPFKIMGISQTYNGSYSHRKYSTGNRKDYPIDESGLDLGRSYMYAPADMVVKKIYGLGNPRQANTVWLQTKEKVITPIGISYVTGRVTHMEDEDIQALKIGSTFKAGTKMFREGKDGGATGNHIHMTWGTNRYKSPGWLMNNLGAYVLTTTGTNKKPEELFFVDKKFTLVKSSDGLPFKTKPTPVTRYVNTGSSKLNVRESYSVTAKIVDKLENNEKVTVYTTWKDWALIGEGRWVSSKYLKEKA